ncbi:MAG: haloacid dehalogenase type II [Rhodothermaceae bacterium]|nr:haloacid dehalogenase type II [Rhodothermaceae bacterium]MYF63087.1 haloacid dehalogenase type II [Rhodothermaceae bacterium]
MNQECSRRLRSFKALTFDVYGTLIDWETGISNALRPLIDQVVRNLSRDEVLEAHARYESYQQALTPSKLYRDVLAVVYRRLAEHWKINVTWEECLRYGQSVREWPVFSDSVESLRYLKDHYQLFVLSNVDNDSIAWSNEKLGVSFDGIYSAEDIGSYKPRDRNFEFMIDQLDTLGIKKGEILHTAESMFHDHLPANRAGVASCHIYRRSKQDGYGATMPPTSRPHYDFRFTSMAELVKAHQGAT